MTQFDDDSIPAQAPITADEETERRPLRPRLLVGGALVAFWTAFWTALGWGIVVLPLLALGAGIGLVVAARRRVDLGLDRLTLPQVRRPQLRIPSAPRVPLPSVSRVPRPAVREKLGAAGRVATARARRLPVREVAGRAKEAGRAVVESAREPAAALAAKGVEAATQARRVAEHQARRAAETRRPVREQRERRQEPQRGPEPRRERSTTTMQQALAAVSEGARSRRAGRDLEATAAYARAAAAFRGAGDLRAAAFALSNEGMSLARAGATEAAISRLEEAAAVLRELGDDHAEGQVLANLGSVHRRAGRRDEALDYWRDAATRLDDDSPERAQVEQQLLRAS